MSVELVVIGASLGGTAALVQLLSGLTRGVHPAIAVVQHRGASSGHALLSKLRKATDLCATEPDDKTPIERGTLYLAPANYHMLVDPGRIELSTDAPVACSRPSVDALFTSAATAYGSRAVSIVLTGSNTDGAQGTAAILAAGGQAFAQHPSMAEAPSMPAAAVRAGATPLPLDDLTHWMTSLDAR